MNKPIISLSNKINSVDVYESIMKQVKESYKNYGRSEVPIISLEKVESIEASSIVNLICILNILKNVYKSRIPLTLNYNPKLIYFLHSINFFHYINKLSLAEVNSEYIGGFSDYINKEYRKQHKLHVYTPILDNYDEFDVSQQKDYRAKLFEELAYFIVPRDYKEVLSDRKQLSEQELDQTIMILSEIVANAILYSKSLCFAFLQTSRYKTVISVSDTGVGFESSLQQRLNSGAYTKEQKEAFLREVIKIQYKYKNLYLRDYFIILESLYYSQLQDRINLWRLKRLITNTGGKLKIHCNTTQVVFSGNRCKGCNKDALVCVSCVLEAINSNIIYSSVKIFDAKLVGVHIEIEI